jgi:RNA recognition motif. (a.k.a. RRM, RBD, or RNP domain)
VTGIHPRLTESDISRLFEKYGDVENCSIMVDPHTKESRGFGFVKMVTPEQADAAKEGLQGEVIDGRTLSIEKARRSRPRTPTPGKYFGPPKRGKFCLTSASSQVLTCQGKTFEDHLAVAIAMMIDADLGLVVSTTTIDMAAMTHTTIAAAKAVVITDVTMVGTMGANTIDATIVKNMVIVALTGTPPDVGTVMVVAMIVVKITERIVGTIMTVMPMLLVTIRLRRVNPVKPTVAVPMKTAVRRDTVVGR